MGKDAGWSRGSQELSTALHGHKLAWPVAAVLDREGTQQGEYPQDRHICSAVALLRSLQFSRQVLCAQLDEDHLGSQDELRFSPK